LRTVYLGTSEFAATVLGRVAASDHRPALVVTSPDRRRGRGRRMQAPPAAEAARELDLELHQTADVNEPEATERIQGLEPDAIAVCAFGQLIREPLLSELMLNVHPSLVPRWRGAAPIERAIMAGDAATGVTIMRVTEGLDSGPVALREEIPIEPGEYFDSLAGRLATSSGEILVEALDRLGRGELEFAEQEEGEATYAEKIAPEERRLDPARSAEELARAVRALNPHIGTHLELSDGGRLGVRRASPVPDGPGAGELTVVEGAPVLGTADGGLRLEELQAPGGKPLPAEEFLRGRSLPDRAR
jgi:methionyl-tRNA formyltransferase